MATERTPTPDTPNRASLCPSCDSPVLRITGSVVVDFDVRVSGSDRELSVVGEAIATDGWELDDDVHCPACGWRGTVADVAPLRTR